MSIVFTRQDRNLYDVLNQATEDELLLLSKIIGEKFSSDIDTNCTDPFKIARELQLMGGHSAANLWRGHGVSYWELAKDAADKVGADTDNAEDIDDIEWALLETLVEKALEKMSADDRQSFFEEIGKNAPGKAFTLTDILKPGVTVGPSIYLAVANVSMPHILRTLGLSAAANFMGGRVATAAIPVVGWGLALGSVLHSMAGTAYTVTIPCSAYVGAIRARIKAEKLDL